MWLLTISVLTATGSSGALVSCAVPVLPLAQVASHQSDPQPRVETPEELRETSYDDSVLRAPGVDDSTRDTAAIRLLRATRPSAEAALEAAIESGDVRIVRSIALGIAAVETPPTVLLGPLLAALETSSSENIEPIAHALTRYGDPAHLALLRTARMAGATVVARSNAIRALPLFPSRVSGDVLLVLADPSGPEPESIRAVALSTLALYAPVEISATYESLVSWWSRVRERPPEAWLMDVATRTRERLLATQRANDDLRKRIASATRDWYVENALDRQFARLPTDLEDPLWEVRSIALSRLVLLLRDSVPIPEELQGAALARLRDPEPAIRSQALGMLDDLDPREAADILLALLDEEKDPAVLTVAFDQLATRPDLRSLPLIERYFDHAVVGPAARRASWTLVSRGELDLEAQERILHAARAVWNRSPRPAAARLMVYLGDDADRDQLATLLGGPDTDLSGAIAEGLAAKKIVDPLIAAASHESVYPHAIRAISDGPATLEALALLLGLQPPDRLASRWDESIRNLGRRLPPSLMLEADTMLRNSLAIDDATRITLLTAALTGTGRDMEDALRIDLIARVAPLMFKSDEYLRAWELIESLPDSLRQDSDVAPLRFTSALMTGRFDLAAMIFDRPDPWILALETHAAPLSEVAARVEAEILRRYSSSMTDGERQRLDRWKLGNGSSRPMSMGRR